MRMIRNGLVIAWHWFWLRVWVALWCIQHGRVWQFRTAVAHVEECRRREVRRGLWELRMQGRVRAERDEDGELIYFANDKSEDKR